jgi:hypothetical protein
MNDLEKTRKDEPEEERGRGPNLVLIYSLILLAMLAAAAIAALIVLPFYRTR